MASYSILNDLELIDLLKKDDEPAFAEIYARYAGLLASFASSKLFDAEDARDIIHDVFVKLWQERKQLQIDRDVKAYLFKTTRYRIVDKIRKNITREEYADMMQALASNYEPGIEQQIAAKELQQSIAKSLDELSPRVKEIYLLSREENLSITEIAALLQLSEQTVKNQLSTALNHLRQSLAIIPAIAFTFWWLF
ncbi:MULTISPECIES: RNA polymerase sigma-70 factor [unclassified Mucilaginibacter]|uniref:RNA polymerase sigma factor n=1 Tax=unclassified Mucilaginibacter TaxID=2617802 RepID=UPI002AC9AD85|nr:MULTISPECIES: RNA polymerase sigma-70 factor [unclassified Mucilaginibacter]MEB0280807.1 RNA polymerase sigma-70 factor [Mucilaginibacter sp. 10B2]MEB0302265.1 RNA polymerase sigma-70 factor [Mucilaginibacter sp. 5C4]WPX25675.1 RNA polymerase sigma-70 factor [Mucilaginibacter sp. 5C4]